MKNKNKTMRMVKKKYRLFLTSVDLEFDYEELQTWTLDATWIIVSIVIIMNARKRMMCIYNIVWIISMISYLQSIWQKMCLFLKIKFITKKITAYQWYQSLELYCDILLFPMTICMTGHIKLTSEGQSLYWWLVSLERSKGSNCSGQGS